MIVRVGMLALAGLLQMGQLDAPGPAKPKSYVVYGSEQQTVVAGKKSVLELKFTVNDGFHVNSHTPKSELLIPTNLTLKPADGVKASPAEYPKGQEYSFSFDPGRSWMCIPSVHGEGSGGGCEG